MAECYYCTKAGDEKVRIGVDGEDNIRSEEWLCLEHLEQYEQGTGVFDPYKYAERK